MEEQLLTVRQVAQRLQVQPSWLYRACKREDFPHVKVGRYVRFTESQVANWIKSGGTSGSPTITIR